DAFLFKQVAIALEVPWIPGEVFSGAELQRVHENGDRDEIALRLGYADQREMAFVESAHGGHESDAQAGTASCAALRAGRFNGCGDFHAESGPAAFSGQNLCLH